MTQLREVCYTSPWIPIEWIAAHGFCPLGIWGRQPVSASLSEGVCGFAQSIAEWKTANPGVCLVTSTACDQMRRAADELAGHQNVFLFNLPAVTGSPGAFGLFRQELLRLGRFLQKFGGATPTDEALLDQMVKIESQRATLRRLAESVRGRPAASLFQDFFTGFSVRSAPGLPTSGGIPLALLGGPMAGAEFGIFDLIATQGGCVAVVGIEPGERCLLNELKVEPATSPIDLLTAHYLSGIVDVYQRPNSSLYSWLATRIRTRHIQGIILWAQSACDLWRAEAASLRAAFRLPVLVIEAEEANQGTPRQLTRLAAFMETLQTTQPVP